MKRDENETHTARLCLRNELDGSLSAADRQRLGLRVLCLVRGQRTDEETEGATEAVIAFTVFGVASGMGSKRAFVPKGWTRPVITDSNRNLKSWQSLVADAASRAIGELPAFAIIDGPVRLTVQFYLPRPKSLAKRITAHVKAPDCSKLLRSTEDAMSGIVYRDDAQIIEIVAGKYYTGTTDPPHVNIRVEPANALRPVEVPAAPLSLF